MLIVYLVPVGKSRFELYAEPPDEPSGPPANDAGFVQRWSHLASVRWHALVDAARHEQGVGRIARWRDALISRLAETIAEQRALSSLRGCASATLVFPSTLSEDHARSTLRTLLVEGRRHHGWWMIVDLILLLGSALLTLVPGPNLVAYYFLFRLVGHLQSWRGARGGLDRTSWTMDANQSLAELASLVDVPRAARDSRVAAIAARLNVPRLHAFFDRAAVPSS